MNSIILNSETTFLKQLEDVFNINDMSKFLFKNEIAVFTILFFIKARNWPLKNKPLDNDPVETIPLLWGFLFAPSKKSIQIIYDIHPTKCFPARYNSFNFNSKISIMPVEKNKYGHILAGCSRNFVEISGYKYKVWDKIPIYCSIFGLPDDCYEENFENRMLDTLKKYNSLNIWCFKENEYLKEKIESSVDLKYMKGSFLPARFYMYIDTAANFLKGVFSSRDLITLNNVSWYSSGKEFIDDMNINGPDSFRFEEQASYYIKKRIIFELVRLSLLIKNNSLFKSYIPSGPPTLDIEVESKFKKDLNQILTESKKKTEFYINSVIKIIRPNINIDALKKTRFLVTDLEFIHVLYPIDPKTRMFNFPCLFCSIIWSGIRAGFTIDFNAFTLPCHSCIKSCKYFMNKCINFDCLSNGLEFIEKQHNLIENLLAKYEGFKIYSYGQSDVYQLEQGINFFSDSLDIQKYKRRNRIREKRIIEVSEDLSIKNMSLKNIEMEIIQNWLIGWTRLHQKKNFNRRFLTKYNSPNWRMKYKEAINSVIDDTISALFYLIYKKYLKSNAPIKLIDTNQKRLLLC